MKPGGGSSLNPYAAAYVPVSRRESHVPAKPATNHHLQYQPQQHVAHGYGVHQAMAMGGFAGSQMSMPNNSSDMVYNHQQTKDEEMEIDMDMEYLSVTFSGLSHESINDVYMANHGDLDATIEMLHQLETYSSEAEEYLPDTLDIGDVPETTTKPSMSTASKLKNANNEASASSSSSGTPNVPPSSSS